MKRKGALKKSTPRRANKRIFRFLFIADPWPSLDHPKDTTLRFAQEALSQGAETYFCDLRTIRWDRDQVLLDVRQIVEIGPNRTARDFTIAPSQTHQPSEFDSIHYRTDPPVDLHYLHPLQLLALGLKDGGKKLVNPLPILCLNNEKLEAVHLRKLMPPTLASAHLESLEAFGRREGRAVLKPLHQAQSKGIELLDWHTPQNAEYARRALQNATGGFECPVLLQRYLPGIEQGEQRLWFIDGKLLACVRKLPMPKDFRVDMDRGSRLAKTELNATERKAAASISAHLKRTGIRLAAVDLIDGYVTDFNFTSPGLIPQMEQLLGQNLAKPIISALMSR